MKVIDLMSVTHYLNMLDKTELNKARSQIKEMYLQNILEDKLQTNPELDNNPYLKAYLHGNLNQMLDEMKHLPGFENAEVMLQRPKRKVKLQMKKSNSLLGSKDHSINSSKQSKNGSKIGQFINKPIQNSQKHSGGLKSMAHSKTHLEVGEEKSHQIDLFSSNKYKVQFKNQTNGIKLPELKDERKDLSIKIKNDDFLPIKEIPDSPSTKQNKNSKVDLEFALMKNPISPRRSSLHVGQLPKLTHLDSFEIPISKNLLVRQRVNGNRNNENEMENQSKREHNKSIEEQISHGNEMEERVSDELVPVKTELIQTNEKQKLAQSKQIQALYSRYYMEKNVAREEVEIEIKELKRRQSSRMNQKQINSLAAKLNFQEIGIDLSSKNSQIRFNERASVDISKKNEKASQSLKPSTKQIEEEVSSKNSWHRPHKHTFSQKIDTDTKHTTKGGHSSVHPFNENTFKSSKFYGVKRNKTQNIMQKTLNFKVGTIENRSFHSNGQETRSKVNIMRPKDNPLSGKMTLGTFYKDNPTNLTSHRATKSIGELDVKKYALSEYNNPYEEFFKEKSSKNPALKKPYQDLMEMRGKVNGFLKLIELKTTINSNPNHLRKVHKLLHI